MGANGIMFPNANTDPFIFGDGHGNGVVGIGALNGLNAVNGFGGLGGNGGAGSNGWSTNPIAVLHLAIDIQNAAAAGELVGIAGANLAIAATAAVLDLASAVDIFETPLSLITFARTLRLLARQLRPLWRVARSWVPTFRQRYRTDSPSNPGSMPDYARRHHRQRR